MKGSNDDYIKRSAAHHVVLHYTGDAARAAIQNIHPEDVVPVVRCGKCKYRKQPIDFCEKLISFVHDDFYCYFGKRKEGADNGDT